jgi:hypothetical protein
MKGIIFISMLLGLVGCARHYQEDLGDLIQSLTELDDSRYTGGLDTQHMILADKITEQVMAELPEQRCPETAFKNGQKVGNDEWLNRPKDLILGNDSLVALINNIKSNNHVSRDISLYVLSRLGPSAKTVLPWLEYFIQYGSQYGFWQYDALEKISCENWITPDYVFPVNLKHVPLVDRLDLVFNDMFINNKHFPEGVKEAFIAEYLVKMNQLNEKLSHLVKFLIDSTESNEQSRVLLKTISYVEFDHQSVDLTPFIQLLDNPDEEIVDEAEFIIFKNQHPKGIEIIESQLSVGNYGYADALCFYDEVDVDLVTLLLQLTGEANSFSERQVLVSALGCSGSTEGITWLVQQLKDPNWEYLIHVIKSLKSIAPEHVQVKAALDELYSTTWSKVIKDFIADRNPYETPECLADEYYGCPFYEGPLSIQLFPGPIDHGMNTCSEDAWFSYDEMSWFKVAWQGADHSQVPSHFPVSLLSEFYEHTLLKVDGGWLFGSDHHHSGGLLYYWDESARDGYHLKPWAVVFKLLNHNGRILGLGSSHEVRVSGQVLEIKQDNNGRWFHEHVLTLPSVPNSYGFDPKGELLIADGLNQYSIKNNQITPLYCSEKNEKR